MTLAFSKKIPPKEFHHDPTLRNKYGETISMILSDNGIIPPEEFLHDPILRN